MLTLSRPKLFLGLYLFLGIILQISFGVVGVRKSDPETRSFK